jgi:TRAP-type C4-dicarboxylate transport system substrate-binding protein
MTQKTTINWLLFHEPVDLFLRTANTFAKQIETVTNGRIEVNIQSLEEYCNEHYNGKLVDPIALMERGEVQMTQTQIGYIGNWGAEDFYALEMPFLFDSHDHATRVLEGEIGEQLLDSLAESTPVRGLAFTYSGGFRCIASNKPINTAADLEGLKMTVRSNPVFADTVRAFGATPDAMAENDVFDHVTEYNNPENANATDLCQTTSIRYATEVNVSSLPYMIDSKHSMYLTSILVSEDFWAALTEEEAAFIKAAAVEAARLERSWSVADGEEIVADKAIQEEIGIKDVMSFDAEQIAILKEKVAPLYEKYDGVFTPGLLAKIKAA